MVADLAARRALPRSRRLRRPAEFAAVRAAERAGAWRARGQWLAMTAASISPEARGPRLGLTVGKRHARRAVDRNLVKRVVREAFRNAAPPAMDISVRLHDTLPDLPRASLRRALRADADALFAVLARAPRSPA